ncbi:hypothetical protein V6N12_065913 [Hibiscus sabdariffa]|uniref:Uncharacterized protein n=1 Tax=Hibiscus sabdariffa TaxID=183260 RepID=A0ABR2BE89_9ROSI
MPLTPMATRKPSEEVHQIKIGPHEWTVKPDFRDTALHESSAGHVDDVDMRFRSYESASARKRTVTAEEKERAVNAAKAFEGAVLMSSAFAILAKMLKCSFSNVAAVALKANIFDVTSIRASPI